MMSSPSGNPKNGIACVVDDHVPSLKALARLLSAVGLPAVAFDNPRLFLEYAKDHSISLAIIDLQMPDLSGLEVQRILYDIRPKVPVIIITGELEPGIDRTIALDQGAIAFLFKPVEASALLEAIHTVLPKPLAAEEIKWSDSGIEICAGNIAEGETAANVASRIITKFLYQL